MARAARALLTLSLACACSPQPLDGAASGKERAAFENEPWNVAAPPLAAPQGAPSFGRAVAIDGDTIVVGAQSASAAGAGKAYVYRARESEWPAEPVTLDAPRGERAFGRDVSISGDRLAVAAPASEDGETGAVYVFERNQDSWSEPVRIVASEPTAADDFGQVVAIDGDTLLIGADRDSAGAGAAYVVTRENGAWSTQDKLTALDFGETAPAFGAAVAVDARSAVIGAVGEAGEGAALFVLEHDGAQWVPDTVLRPAEPEPFDGLGGTVAISGDLIAAGRDAASPDGIYAMGIVTLFRRELKGWAELETIESPLRERDAFFGAALALQGEVLAVAAPYQDSGRVFLYSLASAPWSPQEFRPEVSNSDQFGAGLAISGRRVVVGTTNSGSADRVYVLGLVSGFACERDRDCVSGFCTDGVCCDARCDGECVSCLAAHTESEPDGVCAPVPAATDPRDDCADLPASSCATTGVCDGRGHCERYAEGTLCKPGSCVDDRNERPAAYCTAAGRCDEQEVRSCGAFLCGSDQCKVRCEKDSDCDEDAGFACSDGECKLPLGAECSRAEACASGICADGVCCDADCRGTCSACVASLKGSGVDGECGPIAAGSDPQSECEADADASCGADGFCDGFGHCRTVSPPTRGCDERTCELPGITAHCDGRGECVCPDLTCNADQTAVVQGQEVFEHCGAYQCRDGSCLKRCESVYDCTGAYVCNPASGRCELDEPGALVTINCNAGPRGARPTLVPVALFILGLLRLARRAQPRRLA